MAKIAKYPFRILIDTANGKNLSYYTSSFVPDNAIGTALILSASEAWGLITGSTANNKGLISCSYQNNFIFSGSDFKTDKSFKDNLYLSSSLSGSAHTGSIQFIVNSVVGGDKLKRAKFFGNKVCNVLGIEENMWLFPKQINITSDTNANFFSGDVSAHSLSVRGGMVVSNTGGVSSDLPFNTLCLIIKLGLCASNIIFGEPFLSCHC